MTHPINAADCAATIAAMQSKIATQRNEIARLIQKLEKLTAEKAALHRDLCMERAKAEYKEDRR
jgi:cell division protein FtsB